MAHLWGGGGGGKCLCTSLKDNLPHNTCQIYVKPHSKNTYKWLLNVKCLMRRHWDKPVSFLNLWSPNRSRKNAWRLPCCHSETVSFVVSLLSRDVPCECSISECLAIVPLTRHQFRTKSGQFNGCLHACLHENILASENPEKRRAYSSAFSSKMWYSRVICVFLRWGLTYIWHVLWGKLSFNSLF